VVKIEPVFDGEHIGTSAPVIRSITDSETPVAAGPKMPLTFALSSPRPRSWRQASVRHRDHQVKVPGSGNFRRHLTGLPRVDDAREATVWRQAFEGRLERRCGDACSRVEQ
jgi:hypothetical protein